MVLLLNIWQSLPYAYANIKLEDQFEFSPGVKASFFDKNCRLILSSAIYSKQLKITDILITENTGQSSINTMITEV